MDIVEDCWRCGIEVEGQRLWLMDDRERGRSVEREDESDGVSGVNVVCCEFIYLESKSVTGWGVVGNGLK